MKKGPGTMGMKMSKPISKKMLVEQQEIRPRKQRIPKLIRRAAGIGSRAKWDPEIEQYVI